MRPAWRLPSVLVHLQSGDEGLLGDVDLTELAHALLAALLLLEQLALPGDVAAIALGEHVLAERADRLARDDAPPEGGLDRDLEEVRGDQLLELLAHGASPALGTRAMHDDGERIDRLAVHQDRHLHEIAGLMRLDLVVEGGIAAADRLEAVVEVEHHLV